MHILGVKVGGFGNETYNSFNFSFIFLFNCSNSKDIETGEVKTFNILRDALKESNSNTVNIDVKRYLPESKLIKQIFLSFSSNCQMEEMQH